MFIQNLLLFGQDGIRRILSKKLSLSGEGKDFSERNLTRLVLGKNSLGYDISNITLQLNVPDFLKNLKLFFDFHKIQSMDNRILTLINIILYSDKNNKEQIDHPMLTFLFISK